MGEAHLVEDMKGKQRIVSGKDAANAFLELGWTVEYVWTEKTQVQRVIPGEALLKWCDVEISHFLMQHPLARTEALMADEGRQEEESNYGDPH
jgi:hypothetical protein